MNSVIVDGQPVFPSKIVCIGRNYVDHIKELNNEMPYEPVLFIKPNSALADTLRCSQEEPVHYEGEIAFCVGANGLHAVGFGLDLTKRALQSRLKEKGLPWERAKAFDGAAVFGPFVSYSGGPEKLRLELTINNGLVQQGGYELMLHKPAQVLQEIASVFTLEEGDIIMTGTPKGVGILQRGELVCGKVFNGSELLVEASWEVQ